MAEHGILVESHIHVSGNLDQDAVGAKSMSDASSSAKSPQNSPLRYSPIAMLFHWSIAALVLVDFALALSFSRFNPGDAWYFRYSYRMHMSMGMAVLALSVLCVVWRLLHKYPPLPPNMHAVTRALAKGAHALLYLFIVAVPVTGWVILSTRKSPAALFGKFNWPNIAYLAEMTYDERARINDLYLPIHAMLAYIGIGLVGVHTLAALYHHFWRRDEVLMRMLPGIRIRRTSI
jgi:cytochrome b561